MIEQFNALYNKMSVSKDIAYMTVFGNVHKDMFTWMAVNKPDVAEEMLMKLEAINWNNYLTPKEAEKIEQRAMEKCNGTAWL